MYTLLTAEGAEEAIRRAARRARYDEQLAETLALNRVRATSDEIERTIRTVGYTVDGPELILSMRDSDDPRLVFVAAGRIMALIADELPDLLMTFI